MIALRVHDHEFLVPSDPTPTPAPSGNPLDTVSAWWGLGTYSQNALHWAVEHGGTAYTSDLVALRGLERDGLVVQVDGSWSATQAGRDLMAEAAA